MESKIVVRPGCFILFAVSFPAILFGYFLIIELTKYQNNIWVFTILFLISLIAPIAYWFKNRIILENNLVSIKSSLFLPRSPKSISPVYKLSTPTNKEFDVNTVDSITVVTTWVFRSIRNDIDKVGIGEDINIYCKGPGYQEEIAVELFRFPRFKEIVKEIIRRNPKVKISFTKRGGIENLKKLKW